MDAYEAILSRRSVPKTADHPPTKDEISKVLDAAVRAPTHHLTQPWRFVVLTGDALSELGDAWAAGEAAAGGDPDKVRVKPHRAPVVIAVIATPKAHLPKVVELEEHHAVGAAMQNMLLASHALGLAAMLRTGPAARLAEVRSYLDLEDHEHIAGFVYLGHPDPKDGDRPMTRRTPAAELTSWRGF